MNRRMFGVVSIGLAALLTAGCASYRGESIGALAPRGPVEEEAGISGRMLIWRAWLSLEVGAVSNTVARITDMTVKAGGYVESTADAGDESAQMVLRVPVNSLSSTVAALETLGTVTHRRVSSEDVTEQYVDTDARLQTMIALRDRLRELLDKAQDVKDVLAIEKELGRVQADIDSMQARLKALRGQVDLASIHVSIKRQRILGPLGYAFKGVWWVVEKLFVIQD
jgi:hypothetical protein